MYVNQINTLTPCYTIKSEENISLQISSEAKDPDIVVKNLGAIKGPLEIICWYEGCDGLPEQGAKFMSNELFEPLLNMNKDIKIILYSLKAWKFTSLDRMVPSNLEKAIKQINSSAVECMQSSSFFNYCTCAPKEIQDYYSKELPKKKWLDELSKNKKPLGMKVIDLIKQEESALQCLNQLDVSQAYSHMQYIEAYYLIRESLRRGIYNIAFLLPNDEGKYYVDLPKDIEKLLRIEFKDVLLKRDIKIVFEFFKYGKKVNLRPYFDSRDKKVQPDEIQKYFSYIEPKRVLQTRDRIHNLNND